MDQIAVLNSYNYIFIDIFRQMMLDVWSPRKSMKLIIYAEQTDNDRILNILKKKPSVIFGGNHPWKEEWTSNKEQIKLRNGYHSLPIVRVSEMNQLNNRLFLLYAHNITDRHVYFQFC